MQWEIAFLEWYSSGRYYELRSLELDKRTTLVLEKHKRTQ